MSHPIRNLRAEASRKNGTKSKGPVTADGKARASRNALKHGLRAASTVLLDGEDEAEFDVLDQGLKADLQPSGPLETLLTSRLAIAAWRMSRADRIEADLLAPTNGNRAANLGEKITRDRHGPQAIDCLIRYRGSTQSEFWRALAALRAIQSQKAEAILKGEAPAANAAPKRAINIDHPHYIEIQADDGVIGPEPNEPERR
jgi:hypothetical protein